MLFVQLSAALHRYMGECSAVAAIRCAKPMDMWAEIQWRLWGLEEFVALRRACAMLQAGVDDHQLGCLQGTEVGLESGLLSGQLHLGCCSAAEGWIPVSP